MGKIVLTILGLICAIVFMLIIVICGLFQVQLQQQQVQQNVGSGAFSSLATAARALQDHISGSRSNEYRYTDPFMQSVMDYWAKTCPGSGSHGLCLLAQSGTLQCVEFVTAAYWLGGDPLPLAPNAEDFWTAYAHQTGWQQIPSPSAFPTAAKQAPNLGDLIIFKGGAHLENGQMVEYGHIGVVVAFTAPSAIQDGSIEVAEGNGPGTKFPPQSLTPWVASDRPGNTYVMTVHSNYQIATWGPYTLDGVAYSGMTVLGFLHHALPQSAQTDQQGNTATSYAQSLPAGVSFSTPYVQEAWNDAQQVGLPPGYFARQIDAESGFNPSARSPAGAEGIAQFVPATAAGLPDPLTGTGTLDLWNPDQALLAAAQMMARYTQTYHGDYAKALAAYNGGPGEVTSAEQQAAAAGQPGQWMNYLYADGQTRSYIRTIMDL
jgi:Transglycosylase SLT domain/CHAP domain